MSQERGEITVYPKAGGTLTVRRVDDDAFLLVVTPPTLRLSREELWQLTEELDALTTSP